MNEVANNTTVALMAHPDDAEFHCGGTLARLIEAGWQVHIVSATGGQCGTMTHSPDQIAAIRLREARAAAAVIGATYHCLDQFDGLLMYDRPTLQLCVDLFRRLSPGLVITHYPLDYHTDHETICRLARTASFLYPAPNCSAVPLSPQATVPYLYYADPNEGVDIFGKRVEPTVYVDVSQKLELVTRMLLCHESQARWLREHHHVDAFELAMQEHARSRGRECGVEAAEAFVQHRGHAYPRHDLLAEMFTA